MKVLKYTGLVLLVLAASIYVFVPDKLAKQYRKKSVKAVAEELDVNPKVAHFLVNTGLGRKLVYVFAKKKASKEIEQAMMPEKEK